MASHALNEPDFAEVPAAGPSGMNADRVGLGVAIALHIAVVGLFFINYNLFGSEAPATERMTVSLATEVSLRSEGETIVPESRAAVAPELADNAEMQRDAPAPLTDQAPASTPRTDPQPPRTTPNRSAPSQPPPPQAPARPSRIGDNFLAGGGSSSTTDETRLPASEIGASAKASIIQAIAREIKPHWNAPEGADAERLVSILAFELNEDGSLKGRPRVINQAGITESNRPQAPLHAERAIRAVQLAAPFELPDEYYNAWKSIRGARFDRNLSR